VDQKQFDDVSRTLSRRPSRRDVLRGLAGAGLGSLRLSDVGEARKKPKRKGNKKKSATRPTPADAPHDALTCTPNCAERTCGNDGCGGSCGNCGGDQICRGGTCCVPDAPAATCGGRCGTWTNNCGQPVVCSACPAGQHCIGNGSCAVVCDDHADCSGACGGCSHPDTEGARHCVSNATNISCSSTADCPPGFHCQDLGAMTKICIQLCI